MMILRFSNSSMSRKSFWKNPREIFSIRMIGIVHLPVKMDLSGAFKTASCSINYFYRMVTHKRIGYKGFHYFQTTLNTENLADFHRQILQSLLLVAFI